MKESYKWTEADLLNIVSNGADYQESLHLEYKACAALDKTERKKSEVSKDVSSFANSDGGTIVYGIIEQNHVPTSIDKGYDQNVISKEWLDQVINSRISPKIDGIRINPIPLKTTNLGQCAYVVWIPQSNTAHQASDKRYYKRYNFESVAMEDYEIRDAMSRSKYPIQEFVLSARKIELEWKAQRDSASPRPQRGIEILKPICEMIISFQMQREKYLSQEVTMTLEDLTKQVIDLTESAHPTRADLIQRFWQRGGQILSSLRSIIERVKNEANFG